MEMIEEVIAKWQQRWSGLARLQFSNWLQWKQRNGASNLDKIGVYILAKFDATKELLDRVDPLDQHIVYVGQTNIGKTTTLKNRLTSFDKEAFGNGASHSGASTYKDRFGAVQDDLYVSVCPIFWLDDELNKLTNNKDNYIAWIQNPLSTPEPYIAYLITNWLEVCLRGLSVYKWGRLPICNKQ